MIFRTFFQRKLSSRADLISSGDGHQPVIKGTPARSTLVDRLYFPICRGIYRLEPDPRYILLVELGEQGNAQRTSSSYLYLDLAINALFMALGASTTPLSPSHSAISFQFPFDITLSRHHRPASLHLAHKKSYTWLLFNFTSF